MDTIKSPYLDYENLEFEESEVEFRPGLKPLNSPYLTHELIVENDQDESEQFDIAWVEDEIDYNPDYEPFIEESEFDNGSFFEGEGNVDEYQEEYFNDFKNEYLDYEDIIEEDQGNIEFEQEEYNNILDLAQAISNEAFTSNSCQNMEETWEDEDNFDSEIEIEIFGEDEIEEEGDEEESLYNDEIDYESIFFANDGQLLHEAEFKNSLMESQVKAPIKGDSQNEFVNESSWLKKKVTYDDERYYINEEVEQDVKLYAKLRSSRSLIRSKNWFWWTTLNLGKLLPFGNIGPQLPSKYANLAYDLQGMFNKSKLYKLIGKRLIQDGILGPKTWLLLLVLSDAARSKNVKIKQFLDKNAKIRTIVNSIVRGYNRFSESDKAKFNRTRADVTAEVIKPKKIARWTFKPNSTGFFEFLRLNERNNRTDQSGIKIPNEIFDNLIRYLIGDPAEVEIIINTLRFEDKLVMLRKFFGENKVLRASAIIYQAKRAFIHRFDSEKLNPYKKYSQFSFGINTASGAYLKKIAPLLNLKFSNRHSVQAALQKMNLTLGNSNPIHGLVMWFYFPKEKRQKFQEAKSFIINRVIEIQAEQQAALDYTSGLNAKIDKSKLNRPDISDAQTFMELITYPANKSIRDTVLVQRLLNKAEQQLFLTVKLGKKIDVMVLPFLKIKELQAQASKNSKRPLRYGEFKPKSSGYKIHISKYAATVKDDIVQLKIQETLFAERPRQFNRFEPVYLEFGLITQKLARRIKYNVKNFWVMSDSLHEVAAQLEKVENTSKAFEGLNIVITAVSGVGVGVAALRASFGTAAAPIVGKSFLKELFKKSLFFAMEEAVAEALVLKFMEIDQKIMADTELSDEEKGLWKSFKIGLMVVGGTIMLRQAWKGLRQISSPRLIGHLDEWELALLKAEARASATGGKVLAYTGFKIANSIIEKGAARLTDARKWAAVKLKLPFSILKDLGANGINKLKTLSPRSLEQISNYSVWGKRLLLGCSSPCKTNIPRIKKALENLRQLITPRTGIELLKRGMGRRKKRIDKMLLKIARMRRALVGLSEDNFIEYNVAVGKFIVRDGQKKRVIYSTAVNKPGGRHSEEILLERLASLKKKYGRDNVKLDELFTERIPCVGKGKNPSNCRLKLDVESSETVVFFGVSDDVKRLGKTKLRSLMSIYGL